MTEGTHFSGLAGHQIYGITLPSAPAEGQEFFDNVNNIHYIYAGGQWWGKEFTTSTSSSTTSTSTSSSTTSTSSSTTSSTSTSSSTSTTTTV